MNRASSGGVQSVERALSLLDILANHGTECSLRDITREAQLPTTTVHRLLGSLVQAGYVEHDPESARYALGYSLIRIGQLSVHNHELIRVARPWLERISAQTGETVNLTARFTDSVIQLDHVDSPSMLRVTYPPGERFPLHASASGKVFLAFLGGEERDQMLKNSLRAYTESTVVRREALEAQIARIRDCGYAFDDAEREQGVRCVAAPIVNRRGAVAAAVSISGPTLRISEERLQELADVVLAAAGEISQAWATARATSSATTGAVRVAKGS
jgi:IclR family acetate operon transcriptional repressor